MICKEIELARESAGQAGGSDVGRQVRPLFIYCTWDRLVCINTFPGEKELCVITMCLNEVFP